MSDSYGRGDRVGLSLRSSVGTLHGYITDEYLKVQSEMELDHFNFDSTCLHCRPLAAFDVVLEARSRIGLDRQHLTTSKCASQALQLNICLEHLLVSANPEGWPSMRRLQPTSMPILPIFPSLVGTFFSVIFQIPMRYNPLFQYFPRERQKSRHNPDRHLRGSAHNLSTLSSEKHGARRSDYRSQLPH